MKNPFITAVGKIREPDNCGEVARFQHGFFWIFPKISTTFLAMFGFNEQGSQHSVPIQKEQRG